MSLKTLQLCSRYLLGHINIVNLLLKIAPADAKSIEIPKDWLEELLKKAEIVEVELEKYDDEK